MKKAYLIHGTSSRDDDWFPWLEKVLAPEISLDRIMLPDPYQPQARAWNQAVDDQLPESGKVVIVAHSLGCITALRYVERHPVEAKLILVGAFDQALPSYPSLDEFMAEKPDYDQLKNKVKAATVIAAQDDPIAPYQFGVQVANRLGAKLIVQPTGGHFLTSDGYDKFPLVQKELTQMI